MALTIPVAHDFNCPWCWVGLHQAKRLVKEFGVKIEWRGYQLYPRGMDWPDAKHKELPADRPSTPGRFELMLFAEGMTMPRVQREKKMRTYHAHQAAEYAKQEGCGDAMIEAIYRAYWEQGENINDPATLRKLAIGIVSDIDAFDHAVRTLKFQENIILFDTEANDHGVYNVPTFFIGGERYAEQPYVVLREAVKRALEELQGVEAYASLEFPRPHADRPYTFVNMVATIDGKILSGERHESVHDLGSKTDHMLMKRIERHADAVMIGAETLRATPPTWDPRSPRRIVVSNSGKLPASTCFLEGGESYVATGGSSSFAPPTGSKLLRAGGDKVDFKILMARLRQGLGVRNLLVLGGSRLNAQLIREGLIDEIFLTIAPKVKLGEDVPTIADGEPLPRLDLQKYTLVEHHVVGDEVFLRYRRA